MEVTEPEDVVEVGEPVEEPFEGELVDPVEEETVEPFFTGASASDVEAALLRPLTLAESDYVGASLRKALRLIVAEVGELTEETPVEFLETVIDVQAEMVARRYRNVSGKFSESDGDYSYQLDRSVASGRIALTDDDREALGLSVTPILIVNPFYGGASNELA